MTLTLSSTVSQSLNQISAQLGDETVMMNIEKGNYYGLDSVGRKIWEIGGSGGFTLGHPERCGNHSKIGHSGANYQQCRYF